MNQRVILINSPFFVSEAMLHQAGSCAALFPKRQPLMLEIGCGIGDFIVQIAARHPEYNFLATDIFNQGCKKTCFRVDESGLDNIRVVRMEARYLMHQYLGRDSLQAIFINCPDPWPKKRQRKRRMVNADFLDLALYCLEDGGEFNFCTDFTDYGESVAQLLSDDTRLINLHATAYTTDLDNYPVSKYMRRFLDRNQPIYLCRYRKRPGLDLPPPTVSPGFRTAWSQEHP